METIESLCSDLHNLVDQKINDALKQQSEPLCVKKGDWLEFMYQPHQRFGQKHRVLLVEYLGYENCKNESCCRVQFENLPDYWNLSKSWFRKCHAPTIKEQLVSNGYKLSGHTLLSAAKEAAKTNYRCKLIRAAWDKFVCPNFFHETDFMGGIKFCSCLPIIDFEATDWLIEPIEKEGSK